MFQKNAHRIFFSLGLLGAASSSAHASLTRVQPSPSTANTDRLLPGCKNPLVMGFAGDVYIGNRSFRLAENLNSKVSPLLEIANPFVVNFEGVVGNNLERAYPDAPFALSMPAEVPAWLRSVGVDAVTLGNNHIMDFGLQGLNDTRKVLSAAGVAFAGAGRNSSIAEKPLVVKRKGRRIHVLSFNATFPKESWATDTTPGTAYPSVKRLTETISQSKAQADFVAVSFHWGQESKIELRPYQKRMAQLAIDLGADFVYGHHAHIAQGIERYKNRTIAYGLGNFLFDSYSERTELSLVALLPFCLSPGSSLSEYKPVFVPLLTNNLKNHFQTRPMSELDFAKHAQTYLALKAFSRQERLWFPQENTITQIGDLLERLQPLLPPEASKPTPDTNGTEQPLQNRRTSTSLNSPLSRRTE